MADENIYARVYKNGHKTYVDHESEFMKRCYKTEELARKAFTRNASRYIKPRNPIEGEFLPYESTKELLVPHFAPSNALVTNARCKTAPSAIGTRNVLPVTNPKDKVNARYESCLRGIGQVEALRQRKKDLQMEMDHINSIMEHKKICLAAGAYGGVNQLIETLHPALRQVTAKKY